jgi:hypothetical protein
MRFLLLIQMPAGHQQPAVDDDELAASMGALLEEMAHAGVLLDTAGLRPLDEAVRIQLSRGSQTVVNGPFAESKEFIGGYCLVQARSRDEAAHWASRFLALHVGDWEMTMEIRQVDEPA